MQRVYWQEHWPEQSLSSLNLAAGMFVLDADMDVLKRMEMVDIRTLVPTADRDTAYEADGSPWVVSQQMENIQVLIEGWQNDQKSYYSDMDPSLPAHYSI